MTKTFKMVPKRRNFAKSGHTGKYLRLHNASFVSSYLCNFILLKPSSCGNRPQVILPHFNWANKWAVVVGLSWLSGRFWNHRCAVQIQSLAKKLINTFTANRWKDKKNEKEPGFLTNPVYCDEIRTADLFNMSFLP